MVDASFSFYPDKHWFLCLPLSKEREFAYRGSDEIGASIGT
jgi:hypothetical protein